MTESTVTDLDLLTASFDDLPVAAAYRIPPTGVYGFKVSASFGKSKAGKAMVTANYEVTEVVQQADMTEQAAVIGDKFSEYFMWDTPRGQEGLQSFLAPYVKHFQVSQLSQLLSTESNPGQLVTDLSIIAKLKRTPRKDKDTKAIIPDEYFVNISDVQVV
jgi:hypothetical protein